MSSLPAAVGECVTLVRVIVGGGGDTLFRQRQGVSFHVKSTICS